MKAKVLLLNPPSKENCIKSGRWVRQSRAKQSWTPIHLAYCTGFLEQHGFDCTLLDACTENFSQERTTLAIMFIKPDVIVYQWTYSTMLEDIEFAEILSHFARVILVGPWSLCAPDALLKAERVNVMTFGEYEHTVLELLTNDDLESIKGIIWKNKKGELIKNPPRPLCLGKDLDEMPFVSSVYKKHLNIESYRQTSLRFPFVDLFSSRSCPHKCSYCVWIRGYQHLAPNRYRTRSIKNVIKELWYIKHNLPEVKQVFFQDDTLTPKHVKALSQAIIDENLNICWGGYSRAEQNFETLKLMKDSGCRTLHVGYETPIQRDLDLINKNITVEQMLDFAKNIKKLDMWTSATFMIFPWQTPGDIKYTINWCKKIKPKRMNFIQAQGYPNTPYAKTVEFLREKQKLMTFEEMKHWEQWGFKQFYLYNPRFWWSVLKNPSEWRNVLIDAKGLLGFLRS